MNRRRLGPLVVVGLLLLLGVALGLRWVTGGGVALPTETPAAVSVSPAPSRSTLGLPSRFLTPGAINPNATQDNLEATVCKPGWAKSVRPPSVYTSALKVAQILEYGYIDKDPHHYQEDHLVPLELGGAPRDRRNLWPQPNEVILLDGTQVGSKEKDDLEDVLHDKVCDGEMALSDAQLAMARDWIAAWDQAGRP